MVAIGVTDGAHNPRRVPKDSETVPQSFLHAMQTAIGEALQPHENLGESGVPPFGEQVRVFDDGVHPGVEKVLLSQASLQDQVGQALHPAGVHHGFIITEENVLFRDGVKFLDNGFGLAAEILSTRDGPKRAEITPMNTCGPRAFSRSAIFRTQGT